MGTIIDVADCALYVYLGVLVKETKNAAMSQEHNGIKIGLIVAQVFACVVLFVLVGWAVRRQFAESLNLPEDPATESMLGAEHAGKTARDDGFNNASSLAGEEKIVAP